MDRAKKLAKIRDEEKESKFGYVYGVSGPGEFLETFSISRSKDLIQINL